MTDVDAQRVAVEKVAVISTALQALSIHNATQPQAMEVAGLLVEECKNLARGSQR